LPYSELELLDWTFADAATGGATHRAHPYPAKFIPQIPRELIRRLYPGDGTSILDPFCGSGTTLVEAAVAGAPAIGVDLHPLACLISKVKVTPLTSDLGVAAEAAAERARNILVEPPAIPAVDHWFEKPIQLRLASLVAAIDQDLEPDVRDAMRVALSSIVVRVSNQDSDTRYAAVSKNLDDEDVPTMFMQAARVLGRSISEAWGGLFSHGEVRVINKDILQTSASDIGKPVSLVVTSPPYPNAYEYWLYHKYRMYWLGMDPIAVRNQEIGARPHYFKRNPQTAGDFEQQMAAVFRLLSEVMVDGGHACFQIGNSVIRGEQIDNASILKRSAKRAGFSEMAAMERDIPMNRKAFNASHARIKRERILVFRLS
jgi:DNA modification methylase